ncbi:hypothetical protein [Aquirufa aurantiipilula]|uniref:Uncharacterized protein n=1 Tax=Aquirufa aurantiipilula TaxID=2696561 RepID=A0ABT6BKY0_9BACT|nr:hypothetical protein [Aquirufa aurantiipilula]MDF5691015.1 hypothetical protein [Aquirufa aurantiipilula]
MIQFNSQLQSYNFKKNEIQQKKRIWISPSLDIWDAEKLENGPGKGPDGVVRTYVA